MLMFTFLAPSAEGGALSDFFFFFPPFLLGLPLAKLEEDRPVPESEAEVTLPFFPLVVGVPPIGPPSIPDPTNYQMLLLFLRALAGPVMLLPLLRLLPALCFFYSLEVGCPCEL